MSRLGAIIKAGSAVAKKTSATVGRAVDKIPGVPEAKKTFVRHAEKLERKIRPGTSHDNPFKSGSSKATERAAKGAKYYGRAFAATSAAPADFAAAALHPALVPLAVATKAATQVATFTGMKKRQTVHKYLKNRVHGGVTPTGEKRKEEYREWVERILNTKI